MKTKTRIYVTTMFVGFHRWPDAPPEVDFLRTRHRHVFHVRVEWDVSHLDRQREFFIEKDKLDRVINRKQIEGASEVSTWSCEHWAQWLLGRLGAARVEVSEDGENGAYVEAA